MKPLSAPAKRSVLAHGFAGVVAAEDVVRRNQFNVGNVLVVPNHLQHPGAFRRHHSPFWNEVSPFQIHGRHRGSWLWSGRGWRGACLRTRPRFGCVTLIVHGIDYMLPGRFRDKRRTRFATCKNNCIGFGIWRAYRNYHLTQQPHGHHESVLEGMLSRTTVLNEGDVCG